MIIQQSIIAERLKKLRDVAAKNESYLPWRGILVSGKKIMATNASYSVTLPLAEGEDDTEFILPMDAVDLILGLPDCNLELTVSGKTLSLCGGSVKAKFQTVDAADYFKHKGNLDGVDRCELPWEATKERMARIIFACATELTKPIMTGVHLFSNGGKLNMLACDGIRMAWEVIDFDGEIDCVVEKGTIKKLMSICTGETIRLHKGKTTAIFRTKDFEMCTRLLDGKYPEIHKLMPDYSNTAMVDPAPLFDAVRRAHSLESIVRLEASEDLLRVNCLSYTAQYSEEIELATTLKQPIKIAFNAAYFADMVNAVRANDDIEIGFDAGESRNLRACTVKAGTFQSMILPMMTPND